VGARESLSLQDQPLARGSVPTHIASIERAALHEGYNSGMLAAIFLLLCAGAMAQTVPNAHFHHLHLNATDPAADIEFYTTKFDAEKGKFAGVADAVWAQKSWMLFNKVATPPASEITSAIWHFGWGAEDMKATYEKQLAGGTKFQTPLTDISDIGGGANVQMGRFFYAYVDGPDHALIELNTAAHHRFGHIHMLSADPVAAGNWYVATFGGTNLRQAKEKRLYRDVQIAPSSSLMLDNVNIIIYPVEYARTSNMPGWEKRTELESTKSHVVDHIGISVDSLDDALAKLRAAGVKVTDEPRSAAGGRIKYAFIEGPDKIRIEVIEGHAKKD
jgi:catechol 2,3-dioxygenase-like lactoylglutathione lyase family enzyme